MVFMLMSQDKNLGVMQQYLNLSKCITNKSQFHEIDFHGEDVSMPNKLYLTKSMEL
jgi:hypothetical protein